MSIRLFTEQGTTTVEEQDTFMRGRGFLREADNTPWRCEVPRIRILIHQNLDDTFTIRAERHHAVLDGVPGLTLTEIDKMTEQTSKKIEQVIGDNGQVTENTTQCAYSYIVHKVHAQDISWATVKEIVLILKQAK